MRPPHRRYKAAPRRGPDTSSWTEEERAELARRERMATAVAEMRLSVRVINTLEEHGVILASQLVAQTYESLMGMKNFGEKTLREVRDALAALGLAAPEWKKPPRPKKPPRRRGQARSVIEDPWG